jgi:hypothetical protein
MTRNELVAAYQTGRIDRRSFIKGMTALGLSMSVASAMADRLRAAPAPASRFTARFAGDDDTYGEPPDDTYEEPVDDETGGVTTLPSTGAGDGPGRSWAPLAALGGAAALIASRVRRLRGGESE